MFARSSQDFQLVRLQHKLQTLARQHRKHATKAEQIMWKALKARQVDGLKVRRQHPVFGFIVDFYCHELHLIIEIDGPIHQHQVPRDLSRDAFLQDHGYRILRFTNEEVFHQLPKIIQSIVAICPPLLTEERS